MVTVRAGLWWKRLTIKDADRDFFAVSSSLHLRNLPRRSTVAIHPRMRQGQHSFTSTCRRLCCFEVSKKLPKNDSPADLCAATCCNNWKVHGSKVKLTEFDGTHWTEPAMLLLILDHEETPPQYHGLPRGHRWEHGLFRAHPVRHQTQNVRHTSHSCYRF